MKTNEYNLIDAENILILNKKERIKIKKEIETIQKERNIRKDNEIDNIDIYDEGIDMLKELSLD